MSYRSEVNSPYPCHDIPGPLYLGLTYLSSFICSELFPWSCTPVTGGHLPVLKHNVEVERTGFLSVSYNLCSAEPRLNTAFPMVVDTLQQAMPLYNLLLFLTNRTCQRCWYGILSVTSCWVRLCWPTGERSSSTYHST